MKKLKIFKNSSILLIALITGLFNSGCGFDADFGYELIPVNETIRSYPGGGGIFVFRIDCPTYDNYNFDLSIVADECLNAELSKTIVSKNDPVFEVVINPDSNCIIKDYTLKISAKLKRSENSIENASTDIVVQMYDWGFDKVTALEKLKEFKNYLIDVDPDYEEIFDNETFAYNTYPEIIIVEHSTWLTEKYEVRLCYHVMIPPDDWSKIRIRKRDELNPELALTKDTNGNFSILDIYDYPTFFGY